MNVRAILNLALIGATILWSIPMHVPRTLALATSDSQPFGQSPFDDRPLDEKKDSESWESELDDCETRLAFDTRIVPVHVDSNMVARLSKSSERRLVSNFSSLQFARGPPPSL